MADAVETLEARRVELLKKKARVELQMRRTQMESEAELQPHRDAMAKLKAQRDRVDALSVSQKEKDQLDRSLKKELADEQSEHDEVFSKWKALLEIEREDGKRVEKELEEVEADIALLKRLAA